MLEVFSENIVLLKTYFLKIVQILQSYNIAEIEPEMQKTKKTLIIPKNHRLFLKSGDVIYIGKGKLLA